MGQNNSKTPREEIKGPPPRPKELPSATLLSELGPRGPSYYNPTNCVLPSTLTDIKDVKLRPVSQELSQYHPDFKEIFSSNEIANNDQDKENMDSNGNVPSESDQKESSSREILNVDNRSNRFPYENGVLIQSASGKVKGHRRQMSSSSSLYIRENTIHEDPSEESLDMRGKIDPISMDTSYTSQVSIPVKNSFDLDRSYNMTYAQLAEARRNKTLLDLEKRTGRKLEDLSADLADNAEEVSFSRQPSVRSVKSSVSVDSGIKKKRRAPPPPSQPPPPPMSKSSNTAPPPRPSNPPMRKGNSFDEPPVDYDMDNSSSADVKRSQSLRSPFMPSNNIPPPPPPAPVTKSILKKPSSSFQNKPQYGRTQSAIETTSPRLSSSTSVYRSPPVLPPAAPQANAFLQEIQKRAENISIRRQMSENDMQRQSVTQNKGPEDTEILNFTDISKEENEQNLHFQSAPTTPRASHDNRTHSNQKPPSLQRQNSFDSGTIMNSPDSKDIPKHTNGMQRQISDTSSTSGVSSNDSNSLSASRRLSSLLQHDIKIAAQAKATKIVKHTTPVKEKPKDPAEVFREQLQKAAAEREARVKEGNTIDSQLAERQRKERPSFDDSTVFKSDTVTVKRAESVKKEEISEKPKEEIKISKEEIEQEFPRPKFIKKNSSVSSGYTVKNSRQRLPESDDDDGKGSYRNSVYSDKDWVPEDDLSDDNLSDDQSVSTHKGQTEGFKTSIVPQKVNDLKTKGKSKDKKYKKNSDSSNDERRKFDSIKKFKKSVHKSVKNAFGSISKASGKLMKKQKSEEFETVNDLPKNWTLSASHSEPNFHPMMMNGHAEHSSEDEESILESSISEDPSSPKSESNGRGDDEQESDDDREQDINKMKRAGVAYVNKKGHIVLLPEYETVSANGHNDFEGSAPKINAKKKKFNFDATVRRKEREVKEEMIKKEIQEKEKQREEEKIKEKETEMEFKRLRELEARDRLQRLEMQAQMQQQFLQQQHMGYLSAPPLPPPSGFQQGYNPAAFDYSNFIGQPGIPNPALGLQYGSQPTFNGPLFNAGVPGMSYDLNDYMRMLQQNPTNTPAYALMFNGLGIPNQPMDLSKGYVDYLNYPTSKVQTDDSKRNEVYQAWQGPTKQAVPNTISASAQKYVVTGDNTQPQQYNSNGANLHETNGNVREDDSDVSISEGLSPQKTSMVAKIHVGDYRQPVIEPNGRVFKSSISVPNLTSVRTNADIRMNMLQGGLPEVFI